MKRLIVLIIATFLLTTLLIACNDREQIACAKSSSGGVSKSGGKSGGVSASPKPATPAPKPPPPKYEPPKAGTPLKPDGPKPPPPRSDIDTSRAKAYASKPKISPASQDVKAAQDTAPSHVTRNGSYHSTVTNNTYVYHDTSYYRRPGFIIDIYDPYDPFNYWSRPWSPFYHRPYVVASDCGDNGHEEPQPVNVNVTVNDDGVVQPDVPGTSISTSTTIST